MKNALKTYRDPFDSFFDGVSDLWEDFPITRFFDYPSFRTVKTVGHVNLSSDEKEYKVEVSAPGFTKEELRLDVKDGMLNISGEHAIEKKDENKNYSRREFCKNSFSRTFTVPDNVTGEMDAKFENGILTISLKKKELPPKEEPKKIEIK